MAKILDLKEIKKIRNELKKKGKLLVFTNGCFDLIHRGHIEYLKKAKSFGDRLVVGVNSDSSVSRIKGKSRPIINLEDRLFILSHLDCIDYLISFEDDTPARVIKEIVPDVLVKGGDYKDKDIVGGDVVKKNGGTVTTVPFIEGKSSSELIEKIVKKYGKS